MRRKSVISGMLGVLLAAALLLTGAPYWLVLAGIAAGFIVMVRYYVLEGLENERRRRLGGG